jgi:hypothetical protein
MVSAEKPQEGAASSGVETMSASLSLKTASALPGVKSVFVGALGASGIEVVSMVRFHLVTLASLNVAGQRLPFSKRAGAPCPRSHP